MPSVDVGFDCCDVDDVERGLIIQLLEVLGSEGILSRLSSSLVVGTKSSSKIIINKV
jgi:hypothetical protein